MHVFDTTKDMLSYLFELAAERGVDSGSQISVIFHNLGGFDATYIVRSIVEDFNIIPRLIMSGGRAIGILLPDIGIRIQDSFAFMNVSLNRAAASLGIDDKKDYFPHRLHTVENQRYVGKFPDKEHFEYYKEDVEHFELWYWREQRRYAHMKYDLRQQLISYCVKDVKLLEQVVVKFRSLFTALSNTDPFLSYTISGAVQKLYRTNYMPENSIYAFPNSNARSPHQHSMTAIIWLEYVASEKNITITHARNSISGEVQIPGTNFFADGYYVDPADGKAYIYEFLGCYHHACDKTERHKWSADTPHPHSGKTMGEVHRQTMMRLRGLEKHGTVISIWECDFHAILTGSGNRLADFRKKYNIHPLGHQLSVKSCLLGGRTEFFTIYSKIDYEMVIKWADVSSLYPFCYKKKLPEGLPEISFGNSLPPPDTYDPGDDIALIFCKVAPPDSLFFGVLPHKNHDGKLCFCICNTCCREKRRDFCTHSAEERSFTNTFTSVELSEALKHKYRILQIFEIWKWSKSSCELFGTFCDTFYAVKQLASGGELQPETLRRLEGVLAGCSVSIDTIKGNAGLAYLAKTILVTLWGRFSLRSNLRKSIYIRTHPELHNHLANRAEVVTDFSLITDNLAYLQYEYADDMLDHQNQTNAVLSAFVTSYGRLHLLKEYQKHAPHNCHYSDTDSIFVSVPRDSTMYGGHKTELGDWRDEIVPKFGENWEIVELGVLGAKSYYVIIRNMQTGERRDILKLKGINLRAAAHRTLNSESMRELLFEYIASDGSSRSVLKSDAFLTMKRSLKDGKVVVSEMVKTLRPVLDKRYPALPLFTRKKLEIKHQFITLPFGISEKAAISYCNA